MILRPILLLPSTLLLTSLHRLLHGSTQCHAQSVAIAWSTCGGWPALPTPSGREMILRSRTLLVILCMLAIGCEREAATPAPAVASDAGRYDLEFIDTMTRHHELTIQIANATGNVTHPELDGLARQLAATHGGELQQFQAWRDRWYAGAPKAFNEKLPGALAFRSDVVPLPGPASHRRDVAIVRTLRELQEAAAALSEEAAQKATRGEVRAYAAAHAPSHRREAASLAQWESSWESHDDESPP